MTPKRRRRSRLPQQEAYTLESLDQIKVLADPLRIRVLEAFCEERTTKQVAELLGEKPTKLYHHVDALERVGLIALARTRQNRGTVEKYYLAVARTFRADSRAFHPKAKGKSEKNALRQMFSTIFDTTASELSTLADLASVGDRRKDARKAIEEEGIVSFLEIRASGSQLAEIRSQLQAIVQSLAADPEVPTGKEEGQRRYRLTLAYYPLDAAGQRPRRQS